MFAFTNARAMLMPMLVMMSVQCCQAQINTVSLLTPDQLCSVDSNDSGKIDILDILAVLGAYSIEFDTSACVPTSSIVDALYGIVHRDGIVQRIFADVTTLQTDVSALEASADLMALQTQDDEEAALQTQIDGLPTAADLATKADFDDLTAIQTQVTQIVQQLDTKVEAGDVTALQAQIDTLPTAADLAAIPDNNNVTALQTAIGTLPIMVEGKDRPHFWVNPTFGERFGQTTNGGDVFISASVLSQQFTSETKAADYTLCSGLDWSGLIDLSLQDFNAATEACSPGDIILQTDYGASGTPTSIILREVVDLEDDPITNNGQIEFRVDGIKALEISERKVETFVPMTVNGFDLQVSDRRIKRNITDAVIEDSLDTFRKLRLREYSLHPTYAAASTNQNEIPAKGFIAQEVAEIMPHAVHQHTKVYEAKGHDPLKIKDMNHVQYDYIYLETFGAVKELLRQVDQLQEEVKHLKVECADTKALKEQVAWLMEQATKN